MEDGLTCYDFCFIQYRITTSSIRLDGVTSWQKNSVFYFKVYIG